MGKSKGHELLRCPRVDRISQLPDKIIDNILIRLPIADAARTAVLSRKWNHAWINISELKFDDSIASKCEKVGHPNTIEAIYRILMLHLGPIVGFKLSLTSLERVSEIDPVFDFLSREGVQDLDIRILQRGKEYDNVSAGYILPSLFYSCLELRCLKISHCTINTPCNFGGFRNLCSLELVYLELTTSVFDNLISKCPLLEELIIENCGLIEFSVIKINASNLECFRFDGFGSCFRFTSAPLLKSLTYYESRPEAFDDRSFEGAEKSSLEELCNALPVLESLQVDNYFLQSLDARDMPGKCGRHPKWLHRLKSLEVDDVRLWNMDEVMSLLGLIGSSPNLKQLLIGVNPYYGMDGMENPFRSLESNHLDFPPCEKLEVVSLQRIGDRDEGMDLVKLLLLKSPNLKTMFIETLGNATCDKRIEILTKVIQFRRASSAAEVDFGLPRAVNHIC